MMYISTRGNESGAVSAAYAIAQGMVPSGGLFVPQEIPQLQQQEIEEMVGKSYQHIAEEILEKYLKDFTKEEIEQCVAGAYNKESFSHADIAPLVKINDGTYILELWHGPTAAFKDMALQLTPRLLVKSIEKMKLDKEVVVLVATSGDTGKAALEGFKDVDGTKIIVFYPANGVSKVQELQMVTTTGDNTTVVAVDGNFDDCQSAVKDMFDNQEMIESLAKEGYQFSSANSINWGRLLPQIVYYFASYVNLVRDGEIAYGDLVDYVVPTGNFGNILAAWYGKKMGLPIGKLICASNENNVLAQFFETGTYDRMRAFKQTNSPSMDILISSNLERFLFAMTNNNGAQVAQWMEQLKNTGKFTIDAQTKSNMNQFVVGGFATEAETLETIGQCYKDTEYVLDTHTAVALTVYQQYKAATGANNKVVIDSTAHPCKFVADVCQGLYLGQDSEDELTLLDQFELNTNMAVHRGLLQLDKKQILHHRICKKENMMDEVLDILSVSL